LDRDRDAELPRAGGTAGDEDVPGEGEHGSEDERGGTAYVLPASVLHR
jgi:hypothetical protein